MKISKIGNWLGLLFLVLIGWFLVKRLSDLDWSEVADNLAAVSGTVLLFCFCLTALSYIIFSFYDYLNIKSDFKTKSKRIFVIPTFLSYVMNFNLGSLVGAVGMRLKLYHDLGMKPKKITKILTLSTYGHWLGFFLLSGLYFTFYPKILQKIDFFKNVTVPWVGLGIILLLTVLLVSSALLRDYKITKYDITLPPLNWHLKRMALSFANWSMVTAIFLVIFSVHFSVPWYVVVAAYLVSALGGVVTHVPAGMGVFEYIFLLFLSGYISNENIISGMILYRAFYFIFPLIVSAPVFIWFYAKFLPKYKNKGEVLNEVAVGSK